MILNLTKWRLLFTCLKCKALKPDSNNILLERNIVLNFDLNIRNFSQICLCLRVIRNEQKIECPTSNKIKLYKRTIFLYLAENVLTDMLNLT